MSVETPQQAVAPAAPKSPETAPTQPLLTPSAGAGIPRALGVDGVLALQRTAGNRAVARYLCQRPNRPLIARDATATSITPQYAQGLDNAALAAEIARLDATAGEVSDPGERQAREANLRILLDEQRRRAATPAGAPQLQPTDIPRPPGLPADGAFQLIEVQSPPGQVVERMPEGVLMELVPGGPLRPVGSSGSGAPVAQGLQVAGTGSFGAIAGGNAVVTTQGFAAAGENALGLIAIPQIRNTLGANANPLIDLARPLDSWGHTAMYVRQNGRIVWVRGFGPEMNANFASQAGAVGRGEASVAGVVESDVSMFRSTMARTLEYPIEPQMAQAIAGQHPTGPGGTGGSPANYTARPNVYAAQSGGNAQAVMCNNQNCVMYAVEQVEGHLGGPVGPQGGGSIVNAPARGTPAGVSPQGTASQGRIYGMMGDAETGAVTLAQPPGATGAAVAGRMPAALRYIKWGGRVFVVIGIAAGVYEVATAREGQRGRTAAGVTGGLAGGFAGGAAGGALAGAAAGLVCGPGAPVCSLVLGIGGGLVGGIVGALGGRALSEAVYDSATAPPAQPQSQAEPRPHGPGVCPSCHAPVQRVQGGLGASLADSSLLATALMSNPQGAGAGRSTTLSPQEVQMVMDFLRIPEPQAAPAGAAH